ncbi:unnamed protein product [Cuscuta epithymum]|uniref:Phospholipid scramblase n=1 Tax=Cuscuta epithymum TaxID=186058 RepID=A0AAV0EGF4_9ASTE|nr:unnamed protein product [Cuscuta epithymum]
MASMVKQCDSIVRKIQCIQHPLKIVSRRLGLGANNDPDLSRDFFVQLWVADRKNSKKHKAGAKYRPKSHGVLNHGESGSCSHVSVRGSSVRRLSGVYAEEKSSFDDLKPNLRQPPPSQSVAGVLQPSSPEESMVAHLLARSNLLITRDIEWANLVLGFEQENRYAIVDVCYPESVCTYLLHPSPDFLLTFLLLLQVLSAKKVVSLQDRNTQEEKYGGVRKEAKRGAQGE